MGKVLIERGERILMLKSRNLKTATIIIMISMLLCTLFTGCSKKAEAPAQPATKTITDHAGRTVTIPTTINKVYYTSPIGMIMVYCLAPEKMAGSSMQFSDNEKKYLLPAVAQLPYLGGLQMNAKINTEELAKAAPDVIFSIGPDPLSATSISTADKLQEQLNIPVIVLDGDINANEKTLTFIGDLLGAQDRAKELITYCNKTMQEITDITKTIPEDKQVRVYYAEGPKGLATEPATSPHGLLINLVNAKNVADVAANGNAGMSSVSLEQVLKWNPDIILSWGTDRGGAYDLILTSPDWKNINAIKNQKVYEVPNYPFNWFDRPPSINRFLGLKWLAATLYPDYYKPDMVKEVKDFYKLFYHVDITDQDAKDLLKTSLH
jgi:iron complex transport system substrate-binding protein